MSTKYPVYLQKWEHCCLDIANLMERGGTGFQTMVESYRDCEVEKQPGILIYPGFLDLI